MRLTFDPNRRYRAFAAPHSRISIVADAVADEASGTTLDGVLTVVANTEGRFCDLELVFDQSKASGDIALHGVGDDVERGRALSIDTSAPVRWHLDDTSGYLRIQIGVERPMSWLRVGENDLWLGLGHNDMLAVIIYTTTMLDPTGAAEARWLDEIGA